MPAASFQRFGSEEQALALMAQFQAAGIPVAIRTNAAVMGASILGHSPTEHHVLIDSTDFQRAHAVLDAEAVSILSSVGEDHPLHVFTNEELMEVLASPYEWTALDVRLAQQLLSARGVPISERVIDDLKAGSIARMHKHDSGQVMLALFGAIILLALPVFTYLQLRWLVAITSLLLMCTLWYIIRSRKTIADGTVQFRFDDRERLIAKAMFVVCAIALATTLWNITVAR